MIVDSILQFLFDFFNNIIGLIVYLPFWPDPSAGWWQGVIYTFDTLFNYWEYFMYAFPPAQMVWDIFISYIVPFEIALLVVKFFLGHRSPFHHGSVN